MVPGQCFEGGGWQTLVLVRVLAPEKWSFIFYHFLEGSCPPRPQLALSCLHGTLFLENLHDMHLQGMAPQGPSWLRPACMAICFLRTYMICICRGWLGYALALILIFIAVFMALTRCCGQGRPVEEVKVIAPPTMNTMEQLLAVQNAISKAEVFVQDINIVLLKLRALLLVIFPQV